MGLRNRILGSGLFMGVGLATMVALPTLGDADVFCIVCGSTTDNVSIKFQGFSVENSGTIGSGLAGTGGSCSAASGGGTCTETTWAAGFLTGVLDGNSNTLWANGLSGPNQQVAFMIAGIADEAIVPNGNGTFQIYNIGANNAAQTANYGAGVKNIGTGQDGLVHILLYSYTGAAPNFNNTTTGVKVSGRTGFEALAGITDIAGATLMADFALKPGIVAAGTTGNLGEDLSNAVLYQPSAGGTTQPTTSSGNFYADCVAGYACGTQFFNGGKPDSPASAIIAALFGAYTLSPANGGPATNGWTGFMNDPALINTTRIPEPGSLALLGSALACLGVVVGRRRRKGLSA